MPIASGGLMGGDSVQVEAFSVGDENKNSAKWLFP